MKLNRPDLHCCQRAIANTMKYGGGGDLEGFIVNILLIILPVLILCASFWCCDLFIRERHMTYGGISFMTVSEQPTIPRQINT